MKSNSDASEANLTFESWLRNPKANSGAPGDGWIGRDSDISGTCSDIRA